MKTVQRAYTDEPKAFWNKVLLPENQKLWRSHQGNFHKVEVAAETAQVEAKAKNILEEENCKQNSLGKMEVEDEFLWIPLK